MREPIAGVDLDRPFEETLGFTRRLRIVPRQRVATRRKIVGGKAGGRLAAYTFCVARMHTAYQCSNNGSYHLVLYREQIR